MMRLTDYHYEQPTTTLFVAEAFLLIHQKYSHFFILVLFLILILFIISKRRAKIQVSILSPTHCICILFCPLESKVHMRQFGEWVLMMMMMMKMTKILIMVDTKATRDYDKVNDVLTITIVIFVITVSVAYLLSCCVPVRQRIHWSAHTSEIITSNSSINIHKSHCRPRNVKVCKNKWIKNVWMCILVLYKSINSINRYDAKKCQTPTFFYRTGREIAQ